ncbi:hypothetical protein L596_020824 [Steinernema carpocapsae]|uniref:Uncharacterized protein n=1 Tax=Steinernema carpocapsae TaxID=34508 RepID=A0A4U5MUW4_STECR|nr:hypothetical protein L596_020748 [Steinernema carpocapsae]TKR73524.1 hypothetical protein L596_020824 [Steinernema carpocapsae]
MKTFGFLVENEIAVNRPRSMVGSQNFSETDDFEPRISLAMDPTTSETWVTPAAPTAFSFLSKNRRKKRNRFADG